MSVPATKYLWRALPIVVAISFAYATVLAKLSRDWWYDENYSHGLLIPFIIGYILWVQRDKLASITPRDQRFGRRRGGGGSIRVVGWCGRRRTLYAANVVGSVVSRHCDLFLGIPTSATGFSSALSFVSGNTDSHNHLQQDRFSFYSYLPRVAPFVRWSCLASQYFGRAT